MIAQLRQQAQFSIFAPNSCSVCGGAPLASGRECICGGKGTTHAEMDGLRQELFTIENRATTPSSPAPDAIKRAAEKIAFCLKSHYTNPVTADEIASIIEDELKGEK